MNGSGNLKMLASSEVVELCPCCGMQLEGAADGRSGAAVRPEVGDVTICVGCASVLQWGPGLRLAMVPERVLRRMVRADPEAATRVVVVRELVVAALRAGHLRPGPRLRRGGAHDHS